MAASVMLSSVTLKPAGFTVEKMSARGLPSLTRTSFKIVASGVKKIKTDKPFGVNGSMDLRDGVDASGRKGKGYGVYKFVDKYGANVDGYRQWRMQEIIFGPRLVTCGSATGYRLLTK
ncbi:photosystem II 10 kDa polypeptide, chloroplastic-like isoform X3 [Brassica napus]|uniref:photosystem II 10 kDa polypeptide, chloroplastic-like isoform X3 n=1 Tax=Brassica napus TaxID=3708 RepID=UPI0020788F4D|nr:photosystem II 10 kDa polypeptide, chloroplastic-like isoform X3 [Brassica napus]